MGVVTSRDAFSISFSEETLKDTINKFIKMDDEAARIYFNLGEDVRDWKVSLARADLVKSKIDFKSHIRKIMYRPFDTRYTYYTGNSKGFHCMPRGEVMRHFIKGDNLGLVTARSNKSPTTDHFYISNYIMEAKCGERSTQSAIFPLYLYHQDLVNTDERQPNLNKDIVATIAKKLKLTFTPEKEATVGTFAPIDLLDYIYAVLHSPHYRDTYKEFLKTDFPRVPYPKNTDNFWQLVALGSKIRQLHLLQSDSLNKSPVTYPSAGNNTISRKIVQKDWHLLENNSDTGRIYINDEQYFDNIPVVAWQFYIGGYQPAQKWLKDRTGRTLTTADIQHYRKMIAAMLQTSEIMQQIDDVLTL